MPNAGDILTPTDQPAGLIASHSRTASNTSATVGATETGFIRLDGIAIRNGYRYRVEAARMILITSATTTTGVARMRGSTSGAATTSSTQLLGAELRPGTAPDTTNVPEHVLIGYWDATASGTLSVIVTIQRAAGSGTVGLYATGGTAIPVMVFEVGPTPTDSGVDL